MKANTKRRYGVLFFSLLIILSYLFYGPLYPWSPIKNGYKKINSSKATIYISDITDRDSAVYRLNDIVLEEEKFHDLKYVDDFKIIILNQKSNMKRFLPWLKGSGYSVTLSLVNVIYIGPTGRRSPNGIERYLKHELSHLLIAQNTTFKKSLKIHEQGWLAEGIAEYFSKHSFYSKYEFLELYRMDKSPFLSLDEKVPLKMSVKEIKLQYTYYRFFIEFLIEDYGIEKLQNYLKNYIKDPDDYKNLFVEVYSDDVNEILYRFSSKLNE